MVDPTDFGGEIRVSQSNADLPHDRPSAKAKSPKSELSKKWESSISDFIAIGAIALAVILWLAQPSWKIGVPVALCTISLFIFAAIRHRGAKITRIPVARCNWATSLSSNFS
jgi:hypothetical protein